MRSTVRLLKNNFLLIEIFGLEKRLLYKKRQSLLLYSGFYNF